MQSTPDLGSVALWRQTRFSAAQVATWNVFRHTLLEAELFSCRTA